MVTALVWSRALQNGFVHLDDPFYLTENAIVQRGVTWDGVVAAFRAPQVWNWHPLTMLSHMIDMELFGLEPAGHHAVSVALHLVAAALLFAAVREATRDPWLALFVAAVFALHPLRVQSVAWAAERKDVLSGAFWMGSLWCHVRWARASSLSLSSSSSLSPSRWALGGWRAATIALGFAAMLSKPTAVTLPITLVLFDLWPLARVATWRDLRARALEQWPLMLGAIVVAAMTIVAQDEAIANAAARSPDLRLAAALVALPRYLAMIAWPWPLSVSHGLYQEQPPFALAFAAAIALAAMSVALVITARRSLVVPRTDAPGTDARSLVVCCLACWLWFVVTLLPVLGIVQVGAQAVADRYTYVPTIGVLLAIATGARALCHRSPGLAWATRFVSIVVVAVCGWRTWVEIPAWHDPLSLTAHAVDADPADHDARVAYALRLGESGDFAAAIGMLEEATRIKANAHTWDLLGQACLRAGRPTDAVAVLETATTIDASMAKVHLHLAEAYAALAMRDEALLAIDRALAIEPSQRALDVRARLLTGP